MSEWADWKDERFFAAILEETGLGAALHSQGFDQREVKPGRGNRNAVLLISKPSWITPIRPGDEKRVRVHYEARRRGEFRVEAEVYPYEGSIDKHPDRETALRSVLNLKGAILGHLRERLTSDAALVERFGINTRQLDREIKTSTQTAVKLEQGLSASCSPAACAAFLVEILVGLTPVIDQVVGEHVREKQ